MKKNISVLVNYFFWISILQHCFKELYFEVIISQISYIIMYVNLSIMMFYVVLSSSTISKIHKFFFEFVDEIFLLFWKVRNEIKKHKILQTIFIRTPLETVITNNCSLG